MFFCLIMLFFAGNVWAGESEFLDKITYKSEYLKKRLVYRSSEDLQRIIQSYPSEEDFYEELQKAWKSKDRTLSYYSLEFTICWIKDMSLTDDHYNTLKNIAQKRRVNYREAIRCLQYSGKKELIPFFCELIKNPQKDHFSCQRIGVALDALVGMREFLTQKEIDCIIPLLKDKRGIVRYYEDMVFPYPMAIHATETLAEIGTPAAYTHEMIFQTQVLPEQWENYDEQKFQTFLETLQNSKPSREEFQKLVENSGFYVTPIFQDDLTSDFYFEESYAHTIASALLKLQPKNRMYQFLLVQSYIYYNINFRPRLHVNESMIKTLDNYPELKSFQEYLEWHLNSKK